jgi:hypothetical protein
METYQDLEKQAHDPHLTVMYDKKNNVLVLEATRPDTQLTIDKSIRKCPFKDKVKIMGFIERGEIPD